MKVRISTLFDITKTNISNRRNQLDYVNNTKERSQQSNFETILQVISLRSQPEDITDPVIETGKPTFCGAKYTSPKYKFWTFTFTVNYSSIFNNGSNEFGYLEEDCNGVPMIVNLDETGTLITVLDCGSEYRNIFFEAVNE